MGSKWKYFYRDAFEKHRTLDQHTKRQDFKAALRARIKALRLINTIKCILHSLLNKSGNLRRGSLCDYGTIQILLVRSGLEPNPGPRAWRDLPCNVPRLGILSSCSPHGWEYYCERLGVPEHIIRHIESQYVTTQSRTYHALRKAAQLPGNESMNRMLTMLEQCGREYDDILYKTDWRRLEDEFC